MSSYTSQGTIRAKFSLDGADLTTSLFFDPALDYSIKHRGESCAVFVPVEEGIRAFIEETKIKLESKSPMCHPP